MSRIHGGVCYLFYQTSYIFENLGEINTQFENILTCLDGFESCLQDLLNLVYLGEVGPSRELRDKRSNHCRGQMATKPPQMSFVKDRIQRN